MTTQSALQTNSKATTQKQEIACSLTENELKIRRQYVRTRLKPHIVLVKKSALKISLNFSNPIKISEVEEFIELERQCCSFLNFQATQTGDTVTLNIVGPEGSEKVVDMFAKGAVR